ncbi:ferric iron uptake transcriptional regulator [Azoarcus sp. TTM-91]|uniref:Fur family transcriptional regulator n=1 Tax=Azoarcus sp. TTM-91 TaxID=2691581 RepID=UPI00145C6E24|nr:Fur family transcriptional regulator [Azoarcus sp. TTM-91]NMG34270.1 ferric iron uptake transcriptional regulator [Azoarcus sp. TTM-91]
MTSKSDACYDAARGELTRVGLRVTLPRLRILSLFDEEVEGMLSAEDVHRMLLLRGDRMSLSSVYAVLKRLDAAQLISSHFEEGRKVFEPAGRTPGGHIVCSCCGRDIALRDERVDAMLKRIARTHGFELTEYVVALHGVCLECAEKKATRAFARPAAKGRTTIAA